MASKIAIVARAPSSRYLAPFHDDSWEIWTLSPQGPPDWSDLPRWDRFYEIHNLTEKEVECPGYIEWLRSHGDKVWLREPHPLCPDAHVYPLQNVLEFYDRLFVHRMRYYNNSVSLMIAAATIELLEGTHSEQPRLGLWGVDMCQHEEYASQAPSCELFVGLAAGLGVNVEIPELCDLMKTLRVYGVEDMTAFEAKMRVHCEELEGKLNRHHQSLNEAKHQHVGAAAAHGELSQVLGQLNGAPELSPVKELIESRLQQLTEIGEHHKRLCEQLDADIKMCTGALEENRYVRQWVQ